MSLLPDFLKKKSKAAQKTEKHHLNLELNGKQVEVVIQKNPRAKRMTLRRDLKSGGFKLTTAKSTSLKTAKAFIMKNEVWMAECLQNAGERTLLENHAQIPVRGELVTLNFDDKLRGIAKLEDGVLTQYGGTQYAPNRTLKWLKAEAKKDIELAVQKYEPLLKVKIAKLQVKDTKSRWGSCTSDRVVSFSWRLIMAPPFVLDYVVAHELGHILEMNHSAAFWQNVANVCPHMEEAKKWLKLNGGQLHQIAVK